MTGTATYEKRAWPRRLIYILMPASLASFCLYLYVLLFHFPGDYIWDVTPYTNPETVIANAIFWVILVAMAVGVVGSTVLLVRDVVKLTRGKAVSPGNLFLDLYPALGIGALFLLSVLANVG